MQVMNAIKPNTIDMKKVKIPPKNRFVQVENCNLVINHGKDLGCQYSGIGALDIIDGNKKMTLAIVWQLMRSYTLSLLTLLSAKKGKKEIEEKDLLEWANEKAKQGGCTFTVSSFRDKQLSDGIFLLHVLYFLNIF